MNWLDKGTDWILGLVSLALVGFLRLFFTQGREIEALKLHVAENYVRKSDMMTLKEDIADQISSEVGGLKSQMSEIRQILLSRKR